jgi:hypothetical protein
MNIPDRLTSDRFFHKAIIVGVCLVLGASVVSQLLMQLGGGDRDKPLDFSKQLDGYDDDFKKMAIFPKGLPPFISSGGLHYPEKAVFDLGLGLGGLVFWFLGLEIFLRTRAELARQQASRARHLFNGGQLLATLLVGGSLVMTTRYPFDISFLKHLFFATGIFYGSLAWGLLLILARSGLDRQLACCGWKLNRLRWVLLGVAVASFLLTAFLVRRGENNGAALFEWLLAISSQGLVLSLLPTLVVAAGSAEQPPVEGTPEGRH